ncbi:zinc knuckle CX2CX4HX4C containing protein [Tanacetum coccineum]|uniref:Zinc knuckle CX2CX4HX4C containing protein n=1 Tax=Tanacetum coccineum TaxID=301880 RepID=A0ABQ4ZE08_9ASTR
MECGFLSQKGIMVGRGVKEKNLNRNKMNNTLGIGMSTESDYTMNENTLVGVASAVKEGVTPSVVDKTMEMEKISSLEDTTVQGSFTPLPTPGTTTAGNAPGKSSFMDGLDVMLENGPWFIRNNPLILKKWHPDENRDTCSVLVWVKLYGVPITAFSEDGLSAIATKLGTPLMLDSYTSDICMQSCGFKNQKEYRHVPKNPTRSSSGNKKKGVIPTIEVGFGTQSLLKQWRDSYSNGDYDEDPYDDDMYEEQRDEGIKFNYSRIELRLRTFSDKIEVGTSGSGGKFMLSIMKV